MSDTIRYIRIVKTPAGEAPHWVREQWIGLELPDYGPPNNPISYGLWSETPKKSEHACRVPMKNAIEILATKSPEAAKWFRDNLGRTRIENGIFVFENEECEEIPPPASSTSHTDDPIIDIN